MQCTKIMGCQLDGEWMVKFHGLESVFPVQRVHTTLGTLACANIYPLGAIVFHIGSDGEFLPGYWGEAGVHFPSSIMLAATYLYYGERDTGIELAYRTLRGLIIELSASWDSVLLYRGDNADFLWGADDRGGECARTMLRSQLEPMAFNVHVNNSQIITSLLIKHERGASAVLPNCAKYLNCAKGVFPVLSIFSVLSIFTVRRHLC